MTARMKNSVRNRLHELVDEMDDDRADAMLTLLVGGTAFRGSQGALKGPTSEDDPLWEISGMVGDEYEGPTDVSTNKYRYIAEHPEIKMD